MNFDEQNLIQSLSGLPAKHGAAFAASCCERLLPNYHAFVVMEEWGNIDVLRKVLDAIWGHLEGVPLAEDNIRELTLAVERELPTSDEFISIFASTAFRAASCVIYPLECCLDPSPSSAALAARMAVESIDAFLVLVNSPSSGVDAPDPVFQKWLGEDLRFYQWMEHSPLMDAELTIQEQDLAILQLAKQLDSSLLQKLRLRSSNLGIQPFRRGMVKLPKP